MSALGYEWNSPVCGPPRLKKELEKPSQKIPIMRALGIWRRAKLVATCYEIAHPRRISSYVEIKNATRSENILSCVAEFLSTARSPIMRIQCKLSDGRKMYRSKGKPEFKHQFFGCLTRLRLVWLGSVCFLQGKRNTGERIEYKELNARVSTTWLGSIRKPR